MREPFVEPERNRGQRRARKPCRIKAALYFHFGILGVFLSPVWFRYPFYTPSARVEAIRGEAVIAGVLGCAKGA